MWLANIIDAFRRPGGWRGPAVAAVFTLLAGLPGFLAMPPLDRDEARFAQATAQMLEQDDYVVIRFQDQPRFKKPVGIHWMQALAASAFGDAALRDIRPYRLPSLLGAMLAAAACVWGAAGLFSRGVALMSGLILGSGLLLSTEAFIAKTDSMLTGLTVLCLAAMARLYAEARGGPPAGRLAVPLFWLALALAILVKGPITPLIAGLAALTLRLVDRRPLTSRPIGWAWGLILLAMVIGPWAWAVTVATDGAFWAAAISGDLAPKLAGGHETHGAPPGFHALVLSLLAFPATLLLPAAAVVAWRRRREPGVRFALAWLVPAWILFEATPTKLPHYVLPLYAPLAWLCAAGLAEAATPWVRRIGAGLHLVAGGLLAAVALGLALTYGDARDLPAAILTAGLFALAAAAGGLFLLRGRVFRALAWALPAGVLAHGALTGLLAPGLEPLMLSSRTTEVLARARLLPAQGVLPGPVAIAGYAEPSLVFKVGTDTGLGDAADAARALASGRAAVVEGREQPAFRAALARNGVTPVEVGRVAGLNYSNGDVTELTIYAPPPEVRP
jgi:4-amino-4-deoxy-L-arabinose transferase-like glycosyltransferase